MLDKDWAVHHSVDAQSKVVEAELVYKLGLWKENDGVLTNDHY